MQRVRHDTIRPEQPLKAPSAGKAHRVAERKLFLQRAFGRHPVVHAARQVADLGIKRAAHGHVDLLKPTANPQEGLAALDAGADQRQGNRVTGAVKRAMSLGFVLTVFLGMHVRTPAGEQEPVAGRLQVLDIDKAGVGRHDQRQRIGHLADRLAVHPPARMGRILIVDEVMVPVTQ